MKAFIITLSCCLLWSCGGEDVANSPSNVTGTDSADVNESKASSHQIDQFAVAQDKWNSHNVSRYRINIVQSLVIDSDSPNTQPTSLTELTSNSGDLMVLVDGGLVTELYTASPASLSEYEEVVDGSDGLQSDRYSVNGLFEFLADKIADDQILGDIEYNAELGFPQNFQYFGGQGNEQLIHFHIAEFYDPQAKVNQLKQAKESWLAQAIADYSMALRLKCDAFCEGTSEVYSDVVSNECIAKGYSEPPSVNIALDYFPNSMPKLFDRAIEEAASLNSRFETTLHASGYLESYYLGSPFGLSGGDTGFVVESLQYTL